MLFSNVSKKDQICKSESNVHKSNDFDLNKNIDLSIDSSLTLNVNQNDSNKFQYIKSPKYSDFDNIKNNYGFSLQNQLGQVDSFENNNSKVTLSNQSSEIYQQNITKQHISSLSNDVRSNTASSDLRNKDDELIKQKRIEAITKHLKTDLIKASLMTNSNSHSTTMANNLLNNAYINEKNNINQSLTYAPNFSSAQFNYCGTSNLVKEHNVPNVTIQPNPQPLKQQTMFNNNLMVDVGPKHTENSVSSRTRDFHGNNDNNTIQLMNDEFIDDFLLQNPPTNSMSNNNNVLHSNNNFNNANNNNVNNNIIHQFSNEQNFLRKRLQETIMQRHSSVNPSHSMLQQPSVQQQNMMQISSIQNSSNYGNSKKHIYFYI
jgi:hypothetical protein